MAKILNYQNYHKITVAQHRHQRQRQRHPQPQTQQQFEEFQQLVQRQPTTPANQTNQGKHLPNNIRIYSHPSKTRQQHVGNSTQQRDSNQQHLQHVAFPQYHHQQQQRQHDCNERRHHHHPNRSNNHVAQLTAMAAANTKHCNNHHHKHLQNSLSNSPQTYTSASSSKSPSATSSSISSDSSSSSLRSIGSATYSTNTTTCCVLTYNLFAAYAEAATLQLKRKTSFNKLFYASGRHTDMRSICYLILMAFVYWGVMIRAAVATNLTSAAATAATNAASLSTAATLAPTMPLAVELSSNLTISAGSIVAYGHGRASPTYSQQHQHTDNNSNNSNNSRSDSSHNTSRSLRPHLPISSVSSDILTNYQRRLLTRREAANVPDFEDDDSSYHDDEFDEYEALIRNKSAKGKYIGAPCNNMSCETTLLHVTCDKETQICGCERNYPVQLGLTRGCDKPKKLGEQCFYDETCQYNDENSLCVQVRHNALCQCANGFHSVSYNKPTRRVFCTQDLDELNSDLPTLLGVCVGIGVLAGLICMVLHLFSKTKYPRHRNFGDANLPPPIMYSSETVQSGRPSSRSSIRSSGGSIGSYGNRRSSTGGVTATTNAGSKGILVSTSRTGSRRPSLASVHSTSSSVRSYSMIRFEKEQQQKEIRHEMKLRLARLQQHQQHQHLGQYKPQIIIGDTALTMQQHGIGLGRITMATPSPMTPNSTDELLPAVDENQEYPPRMESLAKSCPESVASATLSAIKNVAVSSGTTPKLTSTTNYNVTATAAAAAAATAAAAAAAAPTTDMANAAAYIGPCSSSTEAL